MKRHLKQVVAFLLLPTLLADPVLASAHTARVYSSQPSLTNPIFQAQAFQPMARWVHSTFPWLTREGRRQLMLGSSIEKLDLMKGVSSKDQWSLGRLYRKSIFGILDFMLAEPANYHVWVLRDNRGTIQGILKGHFRARTSRLALTSLMVNPGFRRMKIATRLLNHAMKTIHQSMPEVDEVYAADMSGGISADILTTLEAPLTFVHLLQNTYHWLRPAPVLESGLKLSAVLRKAAEHQFLSDTERMFLKMLMVHDPIQRDIFGVTQENVDQKFDERLPLFRKTLPNFHQILRESAIHDMSDSTYWSIYVPLALWLYHRKLQLRPDEAYVVGFSGSIGVGKTTRTRIIENLLKELLRERTEQVVTFSIDDLYKTKTERAPLKEKGYRYRAPPGTHDVALGVRVLRELRKSNADSIVQLPVFGKEEDDRTGWREVRGKVGIVLLEGWFVGAQTDVDPLLVEPGFRQTVASALREYKPLNDELDDLIVRLLRSRDAIKVMYKEQVAKQRERHELAGKVWRGLVPDEIEPFVDYLYDSWDWVHTTPEAPFENTSLQVITDDHRQILDMHLGGRTSRSDLPFATVAKTVYGMILLEAKMGGERLASMQGEREVSKFLDSYPVLHEYVRTRNLDKIEQFIVLEVAPVLETRIHFSDYAETMLQSVKDQTFEKDIYRASFVQALVWARTMDIVHAHLEVLSRDSSRLTILDEDALFELAEQIMEWTKELRVWLFEQSGGKKLPGRKRPYKWIEVEQALIQRHRMYNGSVFRKIKKHLQKPYLTLVGESRKEEVSVHAVGVVNVGIPAPLRPYAEKMERVFIPGDTLGAVIKQLLVLFPQMHNHLLNERGQLRSQVHFRVNDEYVLRAQEKGVAREFRYRNWWEIPLKEDDRVDIVPSMLGGSGVEEEELQALEHAEIKSIESLFPPATIRPVELALRIWGFYGKNWTEALSLMGDNLLDRNRHELIVRGIRSHVPPHVLGDWLRFSAPWARRFEDIPEPLSGFLLAYSANNPAVSRLTAWAYWQIYLAFIDTPSPMNEQRFAAAIPKVSNGNYHSAYNPFGLAHHGSSEHTLVLPSLVAGTLRKNQLVFTVGPSLLGDAQVFGIWLVDPAVIALLPEKLHARLRHGRLLLATVEFKIEPQASLATIGALQVWLHSSKHLSNAARKYLGHMERTTERAFRAYLSQEDIHQVLAPTGAEIVEKAETYIHPNTVQRLNTVYAEAGYRLILHTDRKWWWQLHLKEKPFATIPRSPWGQILMEALSGGTKMAKLLLEPHIMSFLQIYPDLKRRMISGDLKEIEKYIVTHVAPEQETQIQFTEPGPELLATLRTVYFMRPSDAVEVVREMLLQQVLRIVLEHSEAIFPGVSRLVVLRDSQRAELVYEVMSWTVDYQAWLLKHRLSTEDAWKEAQHEMGVIVAHIFDRHRAYNTRIFNGTREDWDKPYLTLPATNSGEPGIVLWSPPRDLSPKDKTIWNQLNSVKGGIVRAWPLSKNSGISYRTFLKHLPRVASLHNELRRQAGYTLERMLYLDVKSDAYRLLFHGNAIRSVGEIARILGVTKRAVYRAGYVTWVNEIYQRRSHSAPRHQKDQRLLAAAA